jgi:hypothetical protein
MRVLVVIALLVCAVFMILFVTASFVRELSRLSYHSPPNLDNCDDWDVALDEFDDTAPPAVPYTEQWPVGPHRIARTPGCNFPGSPNAVDDLRSVL